MVSYFLRNGHLEECHTAAVFEPKVLISGFDVALFPDGDLLGHCLLVVLSFVH